MRRLASFIQYPTTPAENARGESSTRQSNGISRHQFVEGQGFGKTRPAAPNTDPDGADNPAGRQKNRRVEVVIDTCK